MSKGEIVDKNEFSPLEIIKSEKDENFYQNEVCDNNQVIGMKIIFKKMIFEYHFFLSKSRTGIRLMYVPHLLLFQYDEPLLNFVGHRSSYDIIFMDMGDYFNTLGINLYFTVSMHHIDM